MLRFARHAAALLALTGGAAAVQARELPARPVRYDDVLAHVRAGTPPAELLAGCDVIFTLSPAQRRELRQAGAPAALVDALQARRVAVGDVIDFVVILDCSGSMKDGIGPGTTKMDAAKAVVADLFRAIPDGRNLAFLVYGHDAGLGCGAVKVVRPLGPVTAAARSELAAELAALAPTGHTPIAASLRAAGTVLSDSRGISQVVVITDGAETCHGDPAAEAESLAGRIAGLRAVEVVGVGLKAAGEKAAVAAIADRGRGRYYDADTAADLRNAVAAAADVPVADEVPAVEAEPLSAIEKALVKQLGDKDFGVRVAAANALGKRGSKKAGIVDALAGRVADETWEFYYSSGNCKDPALAALKTLAPTRVEPALLAAVRSKSADIRAWAAATIVATDAEFGTKPEVVGDLSPGLDAVVRMLRDDAYGPRVAAATALGKRGEKTPPILDALAQRVGDDKWEFYYSGGSCKDAALASLKALAPQRVEDALAVAMESKTPNVKAWAAKNLEP